jgi:Ankyrin repeats (many copies)
MKHCKICNSKMILLLQKEKSQDNNYVWVCSNSHQCPNIEITWLTLDFHFWVNPNNYNSLHHINLEDLPFDAVRHYAINKHFNYRDNFLDESISNLESNLGFYDLDEMFFWFCSQRLVITHSCHNYLPVGSPYFFIFKNLSNHLNQTNSFILDKIYNDKKELIMQAVKPWLMLFKKDEEERENRKLSSEYKIEAEHRAAVERKSKKATITIYGAIRRKDIKAVEALLQKGAVINAPNEEGITALDYAKEINDEKVLELLLNHKNKSNA